MQDARGSLGRSATSSCQRVVGALVKLADALVVEPRLFDFEVGADQEVRRQLLDRKTDGVRGFLKSFVAEGTRLGFPCPVGNSSAWVL